MLGTQALKLGKTKKIQNITGGLKNTVKYRLEKMPFWEIFNNFCFLPFSGVGSNQSK